MQHYWSLGWLMWLLTLHKNIYNLQKKIKPDNIVHLIRKWLSSLSALLWPWATKWNISPVHICYNLIRVVPFLFPVKFTFLSHFSYYIYSIFWHHAEIAHHYSSWCWSLQKNDKNKDTEDRSSTDLQMSILHWNVTYDFIDSMHTLVFTLHWQKMLKKYTMISNRSLNYDATPILKEVNLLRMLRMFSFNKSSAYQNQYLVQLALQFLQKRIQSLALASNYDHHCLSHQESHETEILWFQEW